MNRPRVRLLGRPRVELAAGGPLSRQPRGRKSWALLARIGLAERPLPRGQLAAELFATADDPLGALRWSLAELRASLALRELFRGDLLSVSSDVIWLDVRALQDGTLADADLGSVLLAGIELDECAEFTGWLLTARARCAAQSGAELRERTLRLLATGDTARALELASRAARLDALDESAQELYLRTLVADGQSGLAQAQLAVCADSFARAGLPVSAALRAAAQDHRARSSGVRADVAAEALLEAGRAALDAGAADAGIETLRRAAEEAGHSGNAVLEAQVGLALGSALVHAVRGQDGEGALVLHRARYAARQADRPALLAEILRELAFVDVQAGRHELAARALDKAGAAAADVRDPALGASVQAIEGMNVADRGRHRRAGELLAHSATLAEAAGRPRQQAWSLGVLARSLLLSGRPEEALRAAEGSMTLARTHRWNAFLPWPQAIRAECLALAGDPERARAEAEKSYALGCELGDPCWEGMAARMLGLLALHKGDHEQAWEWLREARVRSDRVSDRYVWVSGYIALAQLQLAAESDPALVAPLADELYNSALRHDLPEFQAWALVYRNATGDLGLAREVACGIDNPALCARVTGLET